MVWPVRDVDRMTRLLAIVGVEESQVLRTAIPGEPGAERLIVLRQGKRQATMNHAIAWVLTVIHVAAAMRYPE